MSRLRLTAVHPDGTRVYAGTQSYVATIDTATDTVVDTTALEHPHNIALSPTGDRLYATTVAERVMGLDPPRSTSWPRRCSSAWARGHRHGHTRPARDRRLDLVQHGRQGALGAAGDDGLCLRGGRVSGGYTSWC